MQKEIQQTEEKGEDWANLNFHFPTWMPYMSGKLLKEKIEQNWKEDAANFFKVILYPIFPILLWKQCGSLVLIHLYKRRDISGFLLSRVWRRDD